MSHRKPDEIKKLEGTFRKDREVKNPIKPIIPLTLTEPTELNEWAKSLWRSIVDEYLPIGILTNVDVGSLLILCNEYGTYCEADDLIKAQGLEVEENVYSKDGDLIGTKKVPNQMLKVRNDAFKNYNSMCSKFGITPSDRARLSAPVKNEQNQFSDFD
jgi:P27 family predicted phage terminase small subunit